MVDLPHFSIVRRRLKVEPPFNQLPLGWRLQQRGANPMKKFAIITGTVLVTIGAIMGQITLALPASSLVLLG